MAFLTWGLGDRELTTEERRLVLRSMVVIAIPLALITMFALVAGALVFKGQLDGQVKRNRNAIARADLAIKANKDLARRLEVARRINDLAIGKAVFHECVENEAQDAANAALFRKVRSLISQGPPSPARQQLLDAITDTITAREPPNEKACQLPGAG